MLRTVVFDIDNTLYDYTAAHAVAFEALTDYACRAFSLTPDRFAGLHRDAERVMRERCGGGCAAVHNRLLRYQALLEIIGQPIGRAPEMSRLYWSTLLDAMRPSPGAAEALAALRRQGLTIGIGTNMTADMQFEKLIRLGLMPLVDFMVTSEEVSAEKPDRRLFEACAKKAGCAPSACAYVGDSLKGDVQGALDAGMRAVWFAPEGDPARLPPGALRVRALGELPGLLSSL